MESLEFADDLRVKQSIRAMPYEPKFYRAIVAALEGLVK
jgi:hypothetical protein